MPPALRARGIFSAGASVVMLFEATRGLPVVLKCAFRRKEQPVAKYQQLTDEIQQQIEAGIWLSGTKLPSLRQQVQGLSLMTVMHAY